MEQKVPENGVNESVETTTVEAPKKKLTKIEKKKFKKKGRSSWASKSLSM